MQQLLLELVVRWLHIFGAVVLGGGVIFWRCALLPIVSDHDPDGELQADLRRRWTKMVLVATGLLLVTGILNFGSILTHFDLPEAGFPNKAVYHAMFGMKFVLALGLFLIAALLSGRTLLAELLRRREQTWFNVSVALVVIIIGLAAVLKVTPRQPKDAAASPGAATQTGLGDVGAPQPERSVTATF